MTDWDLMLNIRTEGISENSCDSHHNRYEPTPYSVLQRLVDSGYVNRNQIWVDYGCGKGRVGFFLNDQVGCRTIGVDYDEGMLAFARENLRHYPNPEDISFAASGAEHYSVTQGDCFYFFNPFSVQILASVVERLLESWYQNPREMRLFFYYPDDRCCSWLLSHDRLGYIDEIDCRDLFSGDNPQERILVFALDP